MAHPCDDHIDSCDHCYSCEVLGVCCAHSARPSAASDPAEEALADDLRAAAAHDSNLPHPLALAFAIDQMRKTSNTLSESQSINARTAVRPQQRPALGAGIDTNRTNTHHNQEVSDVRR